MPAPPSKALSTERVNNSQELPDYCSSKTLSTDKGEYFLVATIPFMFMTNYS